MKYITGLLSLYGQPFMLSERICLALQWTPLMSSFREKGTTYLILGK